MRNTVDPFTVEVIRNALTAIAEEMSLVIMRSARSPQLAAPTLTNSPFKIW